MKKQLAVEWLAEQLGINNGTLLERAKEFEKNNIVEAHGNKKVKSAGVSNCIETKTGERYYNETYGKIS
jgi:hypothetical protein